MSAVVQNTQYVRGQAIRPLNPQNSAEAAIIDFEMESLKGRGIPTNGVKIWLIAGCIMPVLRVWLSNQTLTIVQPGSYARA